MALFKIDDRFPNYQERFLDGNEIKGIPVYANVDNEKVGSVHNILVDDAGRIRYLVVDTGFWILGKKVLLPIGRCSDASKGDRIYVNGLTKEQVEDLPQYSDDMVVDYDYEEQVRSVYRGPLAGESASVEMSVPVEGAGLKGYAAVPPAPARPAPPSPPAPAIASTPPRASQPAPPPPAKLPTPPREKRVEVNADESTAYDREPELYAMTDDRHGQFRLYEEKLVADKRREKTGDVTVTKRIETQQVEGSVPIQKEKIVIEIESVVGATRVNMPDGTVEAGDVARTDLHSDQVDVRKEAAVRQEVTIRKEVDEEVVAVRDTVRREELEVQRQGSSEVDIVDRDSSRS